MTAPQETLELAQDVAGQSFAPAPGSATARLHQALVQWRDAERRHARAVLYAAHPLELRSLSDAAEYALHHVRLNVDAEPWAEIARDESPNDQAEPLPPDSERGRHSKL